MQLYYFVYLFFTLLLLMIYCYVLCPKKFIWKYGLFLNNKRIVLHIELWSLPVADICLWFDIHTDSDIVMYTKEYFANKHIHFTWFTLMIIYILSSVSKGITHFRGEKYPFSDKIVLSWANCQNKTQLNKGFLACFIENNITQFIRTTSLDFWLYFKMVFSLS